jgi:hypothetical protein
MVKPKFCWAVALPFLALLASPAFAAPADVLVAKIKAVGAEGSGNAEAAQAWKELVKLGPDAMLPILSAMDANKKTASNWLRPAIDAIGEKALKDKQPLPKDDLEKFVLKTSNPKTGRRIAYEWLVRLDPATPGRLLPGMIQDPSPELRHEAIAALIDDAKKTLEKGDKSAATTLLQKALTGACEEEQVNEIVKQLKPLGVEVDIAAHLGFIKGYHLVAAFDNAEEAGFKVAYLPEKGVDLKATYKSKADEDAKWTETTATDPYGVVDLNKVLGKKKGIVAYAFAVIDSPADRPVQIRLGTMNAVKVFLNGKEVFGRDEYHHGMNVDQHIALGVLKAGRNELLFKLCQNEQKEEWAQDWKLQARLCDEVGVAVPFKLISPK